jgi:hypothetical protein
LSDHYDGFETVDGDDQLLQDYLDAVSWTQQIIATSKREIEDLKRTIEESQKAIAASRRILR